MSIYRKPAERELGPTYWDKNKSTILSILVVIFLGILLFCKITSCTEQEKIAERDLKLKQANHLQEMKKICVPDHFQIEQKIGDDLWQVSCMPDSGKVRLIYIEHE